MFVPQEVSQTIGKQIISGDFEATSKYICTKAGAVMLDSNMGGSDYKQLAQEFIAIARFRPNNNRLCLHAMLALPHRDESHAKGAINETLSDKQWVEIGRRWLGEMGFDDNQYFMVRHTDTEHDHLHIVASRVKLDGEVVSDSHNYHRSEAIIRKIEQDYKLEAVTPSWETYRRAPGRAELKEFERTGTDSVRLTIAALARDAASSKPTMPEYISRMREFGVGVEVHANRNGFIRGLSYEMNGYPFQGGDIGKDYTWNGLQKYLGVTYVASRDFEAICTKERSTSGSSHQSARTSKSVGNGSSTVESAGSQSAAADNRLDERKQRLETAVSQLNRSTDQLTAAANQLNRSTSDYDRWLEQVDRVSLERTEQPSRNLAVAPNGAGSKSGAAREENIAAPRRHDIAEQFDQFGAAVHEFNAELESPPVRHQAAGNYSRTESREARASNSRTSATTGWSQADIQRQFEQLNRIHDGIRQKRRGAVIELEKDLAETFNQLDTESLKSTNPLAVAHESKLPPSKQQVFRTPTQKPETETRLESSSEPNDRLLQFIKTHSAHYSNKSTEQVSSQPNSSQPTKRLQLPEGSEAKRAYVDKFYQKYANHVKQQSNLKRVEDVDVKIALLALEDGYSAADAKCMLLRSPKLQDFLRISSSFEEFSDYTKQRVAIAVSEKQLEAHPKQQERVEIVKPIIEELCIGLADGKLLGGNDYTMKLNGDSRTIIAHDGRGELLKLTGRWVEHCELTDNDVQFFQKTATQLAEFERQYLQRMRDSTNKPNSTQKQMEL